VLASRLLFPKAKKVETVKAEPVTANEQRELAEAA
jgi:hypothetical protein